MVLVLAVQRDQATSELAQLAGAGGAPVDARSAALAELPEEDDGVASRLEDTLDRRLLGAVPNLVCPAPATEREPEGIHDERLAAAGFAGEKVQSWAKAHARLRDEGQVPDPELPQHHFMGTSGRPHPSFSPSRR